MLSPSDSTGLSRPGRAPTTPASFYHNFLARPTQTPCVPRSAFLHPGDDSIVAFLRFVESSRQRGFAPRHLDACVDACAIALLCLRSTRDFVSQAKLIDTLLALQASSRRQGSSCCTISTRDTTPQLLLFFQVAPITSASHYTTTKLQSPGNKAAQLRLNPATFNLLEHYDSASSTRRTPLTSLLPHPQIHLQPEQNTRSLHGRSTSRFRLGRCNSLFATGHSVLAIRTL